MCSLAADNSRGHSLRYQESEISEEVFSADIERVEQERLQELVQTRTLMRENIHSIHQQQQPEGDSDDQFISRGDIEILHSHLSEVTCGLATPPDNMQDQREGHDYMNQEIVDKVFNETECELLPRVGR